MKNKLPADPVSLILGIVSLVIVFFGCCCGIFPFVSLGLSIGGLVMANKSLKEYYSFPENYPHTTRSNVQAGRIVCIIGTVVSSLFILLFLVFFFVYGSLMSKEIFQDIYKNNGKYTIEETTEDSLHDYNNYKITKEGDSLYLDSTKVDSLEIK